MEHPLTHLLVPLDLSGDSERAIEPALAVAGRAGVPVTLFSWSFDEGEAVLARRHLIELASDLPGSVAVEVEATSERSAAPAIARAARRVGGTVCMTTHGRSGVGHALLGSVAEEVLRLEPRPVLLVGPHVAGCGLDRAEALITCLDGSALSEEVLPVAAAWGRALQLPVELVHVVEPGGDGRPVPLPERGDAACPGAPVDLLHGDPASAIVEVARRRAGLVALVTHGRSGLSRALLGSVAMRVVHRARCPVLVVRAMGDEGAAGSPGPAAQGR